MSYEQITLSEAVRSRVSSILTDIREAEGVLELAHLGGVAEGFAMALSCGDSLMTADIDAIEHVFTRAINARMAALRNA